MAQQTVMNELLAWVRKTLPMDLDYPRMIEEKIESLMDREQSKQDYDAGLFDGTMDEVKDRLHKNAEQ